MFFGDRYSVFDSPRNVNGVGGAWVKCPVFACRYEVPADLEDVARERHRATHSDEEWTSLVHGLRSSQDAARERCAQDLAALEADIARVQQWCGQDS